MEKSVFSADRIDAIVFDVIGTLVDEDPAWARVAEQIASAAGLDAPDDLHGRWVALLDERMTAVVAGEVTWRPHARLIDESAEDAITALGGTPSDRTRELTANLDRTYAAWPDVAVATAALRPDRLVAGVSNGDLDALARLANANGISWDIALSTGSAGTFKPDPAAYRYAIDALGIDPARTLFVAAHPWDLRAAAEQGFRTAYIARPGAERPADHDRFDLEADDLTALTALLSASSSRGDVVG
jgi:2-haloacid dehalogenase